MGNDNSILIIVAAVFAYIFLVQPSTGIKPKEGERYCPKGEKYPATQWELLLGCREGYERKLFGDDCVCTAPIPATDPQAAHSPQTPAPTTMQPQPGRPPVAAQPVICPYDSSLLIGDYRCRMATPGEQTLQTGISPFTGEPWLGSEYQPGEGLNW